MGLYCIYINFKQSFVLGSPRPPSSSVTHRTQKNGYADSYNLLEQKNSLQAAKANREETRS